MRRIWKPIPGFNFLYLISNFGEVKSLSPSSRNKGQGYRLKATPSAYGYPMVALKKPDGSFFRATVSRLVLLAFVGEPTKDKPYALHNDGNPENSSLLNLRWGSNSENQNDRKRHGTSNIGEANGQARLTELQAKDIKQRIARGESNKDIHRHYSQVDISAISAIRIGRNWKHVMP